MVSCCCCNKCACSNSNSCLNSNSCTNCQTNQIVPLSWVGYCPPANANYNTYPTCQNSQCQAIQNQLNACQTKPNPCQASCPTNVACQNYLAGFNSPCAPSLSQTVLNSQCEPLCPNTIYVTRAPSRDIPPGGGPIPANSGSVPPHTVYVITDYNLPPLSAGGDIKLHNETGRFIIPRSGTYFVSGTICFTSNVTSTIYIYKVNIGTGLIEQVACSRRPINISTKQATDGFFVLVAPGVPPYGQVCNTASANVFLNEGDQIFFAITQMSGEVAITANTRFIIERLCTSC